MNNVKHIWSIVCRKSLIESGSNLLSILEILERVDVDLHKEVKLGSDKPPAIPFNYEVISYWQKIDEKKAEAVEIRTVLVTPNEKEVISHPSKFEIPKDKKAMRAIAKFNILPIVEAGNHQIRVQQKIGGNYITVAELPLEIVVRKK